MIQVVQRRHWRCVNGGANAVCSCVCLCSAWYERAKDKQDPGIGDGTKRDRVMQVLFPDLPGATIGTDDGGRLMLDP